MPAEIVLGPTERVPGKPFTDPAHTAEDERALRRLLAHERRRARVWADDSSQPRNVVVRELAKKGFRHLLVVPDVSALLEAQSPTVVGFFGRPRADCNKPRLFQLEDELVASMTQYGRNGLLSYYDVELVKGAYGNLILFATPDGPRDWRENPIHRRAVEISPANYIEIRLHHGTLSGRILEDGTLHVSRTRYIDYTESEPWHAVREITTPA
jgi:hypothetical protein